MDASMPSEDQTAKERGPAPARSLVGASPVERSVSDDRPDPVWGVMASPVLDRQIRASLARLTGGLSPASLLEAYSDWAIHLSMAPGKRSELVQKAMRKLVRLGSHTLDCASGPSPAPCIEPLPQDRRFRAEAWHQWPHAMIYQSFLLTQQWWHNAATNVPGVSRHHEEVVAFVARQMLDMVSPSNFVATNPELLAATLREGGANLARGLGNLVEDWERAVAGKPPVGAEAFVPGETVAVTPGKVIWRNRLMELIRYDPTTEQTYPEPILIVPAWIMKYYILDLSAQNSLIRYLVAQGHTVFVISWFNPTEEDREVSLEDYRSQGVVEALDRIAEILPDRRVQAVGYCLGGTLLAIAAATLARDGDRRLASVTLLAAQIDFTEAGELTLFIDHSQVEMIEDMMWEQGYLDSRQMAGAFQVLRSNDLIWSRILQEYLFGERPAMTDLMAWNADATRLPYRMHSEYLRGLFLNNDLAEGRFAVTGRPVSVADIQVPIFAVGTERDHVAPWQSVHKITMHPGVDVTFLLASGGHNTGIVSPPGGTRGSYRMALKNRGAPFVEPRSWAASLAPTSGSWWPAWQAWLAEQSGPMGDPPPPSDGLCAAPGTYVLQK